MSLQNCFCAMAKANKMPTSSKKRSPWRWLIWISVSILTIYLLLTSGAWWFVKYHRGISQIAYFDIALPSNWERYKVKRGDHHIQQARQYLQIGQGARGFQLLRIGLARSPRNRDGRILLSQIFAANNRKDLAKKTLTDGLGYHRYDRDFITHTLRFLIEQEEDLAALTLSNQFLEDANSPREILELATLSAANVHHSLGSYDLAESLLGTNQIGNSIDGRLLQAQIEWDRGYHVLSLILLRTLRHDFPSSESVYSRLQDALRSQNLNDESRRLSILHQIKHPNRSRSQLDRIRSLTAEEDAAGATLAAYQMIETFSQNASSLLELGDFAATTSNLTLARALVRHFQQHDLPKKAIMHLLLIEALLNAGRYEEVIDEVGHIQHSNPTDDQIANTATGLAAIAHYGLEDTGSGAANLTRFMARSQLRPESLLAIADRLAKMGKQEAAKATLSQAHQLSLKSQPILTKLLELYLEDRDSTEIQASLQLLLSMRKPSPAILADALKWLSSDQFIFLSGRTALITRIEQHLSQN